MSTVSFDIEDVEYAIEVDSFTRGHSGSYWEPPDGAEIELSNVVDYKVGDDWEEIPWGLFVLRFAADREVTLEKADEMIHDAAIEQMEQYYADREGE